MTSDAVEKTKRRTDAVIFMLKRTLPRWAIALDALCMWLFLSGIFAYCYWIGQGHEKQMFKELQRWIAPLGLTIALGYVDHVFWATKRFYDLSTYFSKVPVQRLYLHMRLAYRIFFCLLVSVAWYYQLDQGLFALLTVLRTAVGDHAPAFLR